MLLYKPQNQGYKQMSSDWSPLDSASLEEINGLKTQLAFATTVLSQGLIQFDTKMVNLSLSISVANFCHEFTKYKPDQSLSSRDQDIVSSSYICSGVDFSLV